MKEILNFIFQDVWHFIGTCLLLMIVSDIFSVNIRLKKGNSKDKDDKIKFSQTSYNFATVKEITKENSNQNKDIKVISNGEFISKMDNIDDFLINMEKDLKDKK